MNFAFSEEQDELRRAVRRFLAEKSPETEVRRLMETTEGYDPAVWQQMAEQLGLQSLTIPEEFGGVGLRLRRADRGARGDGRRRCCAPRTSPPWPWPPTPCSPRATTAAKKYLLPGIASGETIGTLAITEDNGRWDFDGIDAGGDPVGRGLDPQRPQDASSSTATSPTWCWWPAAPTKGVSLFGVEGRRRRA